jgi:hypothetical protein
MELLKRYPLLSALAFVVVLLLVVLAVEYASSAALRSRTAARSGSPATPVQTKLLPAIAAINPDQEYPETAARPLFTPTRRPAPAQAQTASPTMVKGQFSLTAVMSAGGTKIALLREKSSGRVVRVEEGKEVNGVTVSRIDREQVTLAQGGDQEVVSLLVTKGGGASALGASASGGPFAPNVIAQPPAPAAEQANPAARAAPGAAPGSAPVSAPAPAPSFGGTPATRSQPMNQTPFGSQPVTDPTTATPPTSQAPLTPEELLARRRARRNQQQCVMP